MQELSGMTLQASLRRRGAFGWIEDLRQLDVDGSESSDYDSDGEQPEQVWVTPDDPNKPKRPVSAYLCFTSSRREQIAVDQPELAKNVTEMAKTLGKEWKELDEEARKPFIALAEKDKGRYQAQMKDYKPLAKVLVPNPALAAGGSGSRKRKRRFKDPNAPKRPRSTYMMFCAEQRARCPRSPGAWRLWCSASTPCLRTRRSLGRAGLFLM